MKSWVWQVRLPLFLDLRSLATWHEFPVGALVGAVCRADTIGCRPTSCTDGGTGLWLLGFEGADARAQIN